MAVKPINFRAEDVQATLEGRKTHTCRPIKLKPHPYGQEWGAPWPRMGLWIFTGGFGLSAAVQIVKPPYQVGDELYVRETWRPMRDLLGTGYMGSSEAAEMIEYKAHEGDLLKCKITKAGDGTYWVTRTSEYDRIMSKAQYWSTRTGGSGPWHPSIHMPKWASRRTLVVTGVGAFRVQDITPEICIAEGFVSHLREHDACVDLLKQMARYWDSLYKPPFDVASNCWVFGYDYEVKEAK